MPELRIVTAHGQMAEHELEEVMLAFVRGEADVLVATSIIESGLDIPQANTLIVDRADRLGLSQLYQIRGRVGRSDVTAHAYLFYPDAASLTREASSRLRALADYTELGSGLRIAMRDLEIRGAGNLLGDEQSGHVAAIGFELYLEMLNEAVLRGQGEEPPEREVRVDIAVSAYIPTEYVPLETAKIDLHRRIALAGTPRRRRDGARRDRGPLRPGPPGRRGAADGAAGAREAARGRGEPDRGALRARHRGAREPHDPAAAGAARGAAARHLREQRAPGGGALGGRRRPSASRSPRRCSTPSPGPPPWPRRSRRNLSPTLKAALTGARGGGATFPAS